MEIIRVSDLDFAMALEVYKKSWQESHREICSPEFLQRRDYAGYLQNKLGSLYLVFEGDPVGVLCLDGENFGDLYIHPSHQSKGYGTACVKYVMKQKNNLRLTVLSTNTEAIRLYQKIGFRFTGNDIPLREDLYEREMTSEA